MKFIILSLMITSSVSALADDDTYVYSEPEGAFSCGVGSAQAMDYLGEQYTCKKPMSQAQMDQFCREQFPSHKKVKAMGIVDDCD